MKIKEKPQCLINIIVNVHQRIQLFYGKEYGVSISSENGTCVTMNLPLLKGSISQQ